MKKTKVVFSKLAEKQTAKVPKYIAENLKFWVVAVEKFGLFEVRRIRSYNDEALQGELWGLRSIRLSRSYRAYYRVFHQEVILVMIERIDKHVY